MRISKNLIADANLNPTKETRQQTIEDLCQSIEKGILTLPLYQRDLSWTISKCVALLNYQLSGKAPVSAISINVINDIDPQKVVQQVTFIDRELVEIKTGLNSVIDGQQRITTNYKAYIGSDDFEDIVLDLGRGKFLSLKGNEIPKSQQIPVGVLLNKDSGKLTSYLEKHPRLAKFDVQNLLLQIRNKFKQYNYTINQAKDLTEEEQINWFEVLNNAGSRVTEVQMKLAKLKIYGIDIYPQYVHIFVEKIKERGYDAVFMQQATMHSYAISALNPAYEVIANQVHNKNFCPMAPDVKVNAICGMGPEQIKSAFKITLEGLDRVLNFIEENDLKAPERIDYINFLTGYFVFHQADLSSEEKDALIKWYKNIDFNNTSNTARRDIFTNLINRKFN